jgi:hypothetical protein
MPVRMLNFLKEPPPPRKVTSVINQTEEWQDFILACGSGLKPHEYITVHFPAEHPIRLKLTNPTQCFISAAKSKVKELQLPYDVYARLDVIYIVGRGVIS